MMQMYYNSFVCFTAGAIVQVLTVFASAKISDDLESNKYAMVSLEEEKLLREYLK